MRDLKGTGTGDQVYALFPPSPHQKEVEAYLKDSPDPYRFDEVAIAPVRSLFLCYTNRSGSTLLADQLAELGLFSSHVMHDNFEYLTGGNVVTFMRRHGLGSVGAFLARLTETCRSPLGWFATKISLDQLVWLTRTGATARFFPGSLYLHIRRENVVAQAVSFSIAAQTKRWSAPARSSTPAPGPTQQLVFNATEIAGHIRHIMLSNALFALFFELHGIQPLAFTYEEIVRDAGLVRQRLEERLKVPLPAVAEQVLGLTKQGDTLNEEWELRFRCLFPDLARPAAAG